MEKESCYMDMFNVMVVVVVVMVLGPLGDKLVHIITNKLMYVSAEPYNI
jgi:hypothetical protein